MATWAEKLAKAKAEREAAEKILTAADIEEIEGRESIKREEDAKRAAEEKARALGLARRVDAAEAKHGKARGVAPDGCSHTFVVIDPGTDAYKTWENGLNDNTVAKVVKKDSGTAASDRAMDRVRTEFAVACVADWNGMTDFSGATENGNDMIKFLSAHPAIRAEVIAAGIDMAKAAAEERKSPD
jgi:hypothetical protein